MYNYEDRVCVTADKCSSICEYCRAYKVVGWCILAIFYGADELIKQDDGAYECGKNFYLKFEYSENSYPY